MATIKSLEEKAKAYDEAIEKLREFYRDYDTVSCLIDVKEELANRFPELKESEDERIRKELLNAFQESEDSLYMVLTPHRRESFIAWLEKQGGEQKPVDKVESKFKVGDHIKPIDSCLGSPRIIEEVYDGWYVTDKGALYFEFEDNWELVEKPIWSEEDKRIIDNLISQLGNLYTRKLIKEETKDKYVNWLKSLKDRYTWKPSAEQMERLKGTINSLPHQEVLYSLYQDLKKLKG